jgi:hypothetical protein
MTPFERFLVALDSGLWGAVSRVALGLAIPPLLHIALGRPHSVWLFLVAFIALLVAVRVIPAVLRKLLPFSAQAKKIWAERRFLAKRYDSYQWQKLFWIGLGLLLEIVIAGGAQEGEFLVTIVCLIGGGLGLLMWHKVKASGELQPST